MEALNLVTIRQLFKLFSPSFRSKGEERRKSPKNCRSPAHKRCQIETITQLFHPLSFSDQAHNVSIAGKNRKLRAGSQHEFRCTALGSRPAARLTWWFDSKEVRPEVDNVHMVSVIYFAITEINYLIYLM